MDGKFLDQIGEGSVARVFKYETKEAIQIVKRFPANEENKRIFNDEVQNMKILASDCKD